MDKIKRQITLTTREKPETKKKPRDLNFASSSNLRETSINFILSPDLQQRLEEMPNLDLNLLQTEIRSKGQRKEEGRVELISGNSNKIPEDILNVSLEFSWFLDSGVLVHNKNYKKEDISLIKKLIFKNKISKNLFKLIFWITHYIKFEPENENMIKTLRKKIGEIYPEFVKLTNKLEEELKTVIFFIFGYLVHSLHYRIYNEFRHLFDIRFILDTYHIIIFELTGVLVSDFYVHSHIEKIFEDRFFFYKQEGALKLTKIDPQDGLEFFKHYRDARDEFLNFKNQSKFDSEEKKMAEFLFTKMNKKFSYIRNKRATKGNVFIKRITSHLAKELIELSFKKNSDEIIEKKREQLKINRVLSKKNNIGKIQNMELSEKDIEEEKFMGKAKIYLRQRLPRIKKKFKFDCTQISPPLRDVIGSTVLPSKKKKVAISSYQVNDFNSQDLEKLFNKFYLNKDNKIRKGGIRKKRDDLKFRGVSRRVNSVDDVNMLKLGDRAKEFLNQGEGVEEELKVKFLQFFNVQEVKKISLKFRFWRRITPPDSPQTSLLN